MLKKIMWLKEFNINKYLMFIHNQKLHLLIIYK